MNNRGLPSATSQNAIDGLHKSIDGNNKENLKITSTTLKNMNSAMNVFSKMIKSTFGSIQGFEKIILKNSDDYVKFQNKKTKEEKEYLEELKKLRNEFGYASVEVQTYRKQHSIEVKERNEEENKLKLEMQKNLFKQETENNKIDFLSSKYSKGNNALSVTNSYYSDLEKLKSEALDVYGFDFANNKEYKKALLNLNEDYSKQMKDAWKEDFKENHQILSSIGESVKETVSKNEETLRGILGPLNLIIEPFKNFFGGFGNVFKAIGGGVKTLFGKFTKKNPTANDVIKSGAFGVGSLFIVSEIKKIFGKDKKDEKSSLLKNIFSDKGLGGLLGGGASGGFIGGLKMLGTKFTKVAGPLAIITAILMMVIDGIKGIFKAKEWGTSKISAFIGSFLGGASEGGLKNAFASMGKWALLGAGIGSVVPVVGTITGGILGAVIGAILGWVGGKDIAKSLDVIGAWFKSTFIDTWVDTFKTMFTNIKNIWKSDESFGKKIGKIIGEILIAPFNAMKQMFIKNKNLIPKLLEKSNKFKDSIGNLGTTIINVIKNFDFKTALSKVGNAIDKVFEFSADLWDGIKESSFGQFVKDIFGSIKNKFSEWWVKLEESPFGNFISDMFNKIKDGMDRFFISNPVGVWIKSKIITPIQKALSSVGDFFEFISNNWDWHHPIESMTNIFEGFKVDKKTGTSKYEEWRNAKYDDVVNDAIIRTDGSIIKTNPKDTLVALKDIPQSINQVREDTNKTLNSSLGSIENNGNLEKNMLTIIDVLSKILEKNVQIQLPPQTRNDIDMLMSGGMI